MTQTPSRSPSLAIVLVDADPASRLAFQKEIETQDVDNPVYYIHDGEELLRRLETRELVPYPGVILVSLHLPGKDGDEIIRTIRTSHQHLDHSPTLLIVNDDEEEADARGRAAHADGWVGRPVKVNVILSLMRQKGRRYSITINDRAFEEQRGNL